MKDKSLIKLSSNRAVTRVAAVAMVAGGHAAAYARHVVVDETPIMTEIESIDTRQIATCASADVSTVSLISESWGSAEEERFVDLAGKKALSVASGEELQELSMLRKNRRAERSQRSYEELKTEAQFLKDLENMNVLLERCLAYYQK